MTPQEALAKALMYAVKLDRAPAAWAEDAIAALAASGWALVPVALVEAVCGEIDEYGEDLRMDWSEFDGRDARRVLNRFTARIRAALKEAEW